MAGARPDPVVTAERLVEEIDDLEERLAILQTSYEKYFIGIDRRAPDQERKQVGERIRKLRVNTTKNTGVRFRIQTLFARLLSYERLWDRTLREIEEGTYRRDVYKAKLRQPKPSTTKPPPPPAEALIAGPSMPPPPPRPSQPPPAPPSLSDESLRRLFHTYVRAREQCGEATAGLTYESVAQKIRTQVPALMEKHNARSVEFKVVIKGGKAVLKAVPKL